LQDLRIMKRRNRYGTGNLRRHRWLSTDRRGRRRRYRLAERVFAHDWV